MRLSLIVFTTLVMAQAAFGDTWPKIRTNKDGSQVYQYQNGTTCIKQADYATEQTISGKVSITKVFSGEGNTSRKVVDALSYSPSVSAVHAALFDMCTAYGGGTINKQQYDEERDALSKLQLAVIEKEAGQNLTTPTGTGKAASSEDTTSKKSSASDTKAPSDKSKSDANAKSSQPSTTSATSDKSKEPPATDTKTKVNPPPSQTAQQGAVVTAKSEIPAPKPVPASLDPHYEGLFLQYQGDESMLAKLGEEAFSRLDYAWTIKFLEQARSVQNSKAWERDFPYLAAAYLLGNGDRDKFQSELQTMLAEMRLNNSYLHHSPTIGMALQNLSNVRQYVDKQAQEYIDNQILPEAVHIKQNVG